MLDWNERSRTFDAIGGFVPCVGGMVMAAGTARRKRFPASGSPRGFSTCSASSRLPAGRSFLPTTVRRAKVVVLSEAFWRTRFDADPRVIGREHPTRWGAVHRGRRRAEETFSCCGRASGRSYPTARRPALRARAPAAGRRTAEAGRHAGRRERGLSAVAEGLAREFPDTNKGRGVRLEPLHDALIGSELRRTSMLFLGVVGFVLLICCANVANLLLARATVRTRELAVRSALGAGRGRVVRQLLTESLVLSAIGGALGVAVGAAILTVAPSVIPEGLLPAAVTLTFDVRVIAFCAAAALLVGLLFGLAPAWQASEFSSAQAIASNSRTVTGRGGRLRSLLVGRRVATAVVLLFGAGLLLRTLMAVDHVDRGYRADRILTMMVDPLGSRYPTDASLLQFFEAIEREIKPLPGVQSVAWTTGLPLGASDRGASMFDHRRRSAGGRRASARPPTIRSSARRISEPSSFPSSPAAASTTTIPATACPSAS